MSDENSLVTDDDFFDTSVRRVQHEGRWFFSVIDVVGILSGASVPRNYWVNMKARIQDEGFIDLQTRIQQLKMLASDGKQRLTDAADAETMLRIIQSIPSPKAEPMKQWLAKVGVERLEELNDPQLTADRMRQTLRAQGYSEEWINQRLRAIVIRDELTGEWSERGVRDSRQVAHLTDTVHAGSLGRSVRDHKAIKGIGDKENLRPHLTTLEMAFLSLGEATTAELHRLHDSQGFSELHEDAKEGGSFAGDSRRQFEQRIGRPVVSGDNAKHLAQRKQQPSLFPADTPDDDPNAHF